MHLYDTNMRMKNSELRKQRSCMFIFAKTYKDFAENTSIHGLKYTVKTDIGPFEKLFWLFVVLCGICGAAYMTILFWERYTSNPTRTTILTTFAPTTLIPFPAVTICNINRILVSKVDHFVAELNLEDEEASIAKRALPQLLAYTNPTSNKYNVTELEILQDILERNDIKDPTFVMKKITQSCNELLIKCIWNYKEEDCLKLFRESFSIDGICCSFNYPKKTDSRSIYTSLNGLMTGLVLVMDTMVQPVQYSSLYSLGLKVFIHSPQDYPGNGALYKVVSKGRISYLQILGTELKCSVGVKSLPIEQRQCVYPNEIRPLYFDDRYADTNCLTECEAKHYYEACKCVPFYFSFSGEPLCNISSIPCLEYASNIKNIQDKISQCYCPSECEDYVYEILFTSTKLEKTKAFLSPLILEDEITSDQVLLNVYFLSNTQQVLLRDTITSTIYLLSSFGGVYSLFMGCSIMTIAEIIYFFVIRFVINMKLFGKVDNPDIDQTKNAKQKEVIPDNNYYFGNERNVFLH